MIYKLIGVYDKVNGAFSMFHFVPNENDAIRGFILQMAQPCDLAYFHDDFELYEIGIMDDQGCYTPYSSRKLLITGAKAYSTMKDYNLGKTDVIEPAEDEQNA